MTIELILTLVIVGFIGSFISGMLGIGGAIVNYPMILYIPAAFGVAYFTAHEVSGIVAMQVFFATISGVWALRKEKLINVKLVLYMGSSIIVGSFLGGYGGKYLSGDAINFVYAVLASLAAIMMFLPKKGVESSDVNEIDFHRLLAVTSAFIVGIASGIVGAGGAFILVPIMLQLLKIPTRITIATSLAITFISSIGSVAGKVLAGHILLWPSVTVVVASIIAAPIGVKIGKRINIKVLRTILAVLIIGTTIKIWWDILL